MDREFIKKYNIFSSYRDFSKRPARRGLMVADDTEHGGAASESGQGHEADTGSDGLKGGIPVQDGDRRSMEIQDGSRASIVTVLL